jgi:hypothetical protein
MQAIDTSKVQRYSTSRPRFHFAMVARRAFGIVNGSASHILFRPVVVMAARVLGPGPTRLRLVKLAHGLAPKGQVVGLPGTELDGAQVHPAEPTRRAA